MFSWQTLLDEAALASLLPPAYALFARPIRDSLVRFLEQLPAERQSEILAQQAALPAPASVSQRLGLLARSCPVLHKLGQILARDQRLALELRHQLQTLESLPPSVPLPAIEQILNTELGPLERLGVRLLPPAIAEASVGIVIPFVRTRVTDNDEAEGVFKVLKPGVEERLELELELLGQIGAYLDERCESLGIPQLDYEEAFQQVRDKLRWELRLDEEQRHLAWAATAYADQPQVQIPALLEECSPKVTAMQRIHGCKVTDHGLTDGHERQRLAELVIEALISHPIFSPADQAMFHCDPHAGNLFVTEANRLAILDWSLVGSLSDSQRVAIVQIMLAALTLDAGRIVAVLEELAERQSMDGAALASLVHRSLARIRGGQLPGLRWLTELLDTAVQTARLRVAADLLMFRKSLLTLEGVVAEIQPGGPDIDQVLLADFCRHFVRDWPRRWLASPSSRRFATRLSNWDLTQAFCRWPSTVTNYLVGAKS
jgi:ubiquinone biosynthesis protein